MAPILAPPRLPSERPGSSGASRRLGAAGDGDVGVAGLEDRIEAELACGAHADLTAELDALVLGHPERERLRGQHMLALYRAGRQAEALASYQTAWHHFDEQLGIQPSPDLRALERRILAQDPALAAAPPAAVAPAAPLPAPLPDRSVRYAVNGDVSLA